MRTRKSVRAACLSRVRSVLHRAAHRASPAAVGAERGMEGTLKKLEGLRGRLEVERVTKKRRLQYNTVAEEIASLPSSAEAKGCEPAAVGAVAASAEGVHAERGGRGLASLC